ncbi:serine/threonine protein kinase [Actinomadura rubrisoli]|uniref:serine/threonine protein kinase n=1 Tax=Actinomadura rubrisoli TaxID=2530368 RepID=UPI001FB6F4DC|nr:serine/threonine-protein kinase [Actinomadura rubrisoli]
MTDRTMPDAHPLRSGDPARLGGYEILGRLGEGGQGAVFLGRPADAASGGDVPITDHVAIKLLHAGLAGDESARARFVRELEVAKRVARFCTAQVLDADVAGDQPYIISEYVPGLSLHRIVREDGPRTGGALERLAVSTLTALTAIHQAGIVHRDFKPHNVMMGPDGPRVIDFGVARALGAAGETQNVGTPAYMAPEHFTGGELSPASDMFAWGTTMVFAATGRPAFGNDEMAMVMHRILTGEPELGDLPSPMRELVVACLAKEPAQRPTAREAQERLVGAASGTSSPAIPVQPLPAFPGLPPDHVTDPAGVRGRTAPQPPPFGDMTPQSTSPQSKHSSPGVPPAPAAQQMPATQQAPAAHQMPVAQQGPTAPPMPPGPGAPGLHRQGSGGRKGGKSRSGKLVPIAAAAAVAAVLAGGAVWAATKPGGDGKGHKDQQVSASDQGQGAQDGSAGVSGNGGAAKKPKSKKGQPQGTQSPSKGPKNPKGKQPGDEPGGGSSPAPGGGGGGPGSEPPNKYTPQAACNSGGHGGGYYVQRSMAVSGGTAYLLYNSSHYNCAVTMKTRHVGKSSPVSVWIQRSGGGQVTDSGSYAWYAGPVYVSAAGQCVRFGGNGRTAPYGNCG